MIISQTPLRISFAGGGTDLPAFYRTHGGRVVNAAIDKFVYVIITERYDDAIYIGYSRKEIVQHVDEIEHELVREAMRMTGVDNGVEITMLADIPATGSGLGSSSSLVVGLLNALYTLRGSQVPATVLAEQACEIEMERCGKTIGKQDQYIAAHGGICIVDFAPDDSVTVEKLALLDTALHRLGEEFLLFYTAGTRQAVTILSEQSRNTADRTEELTEILALAQEAKEAVKSGDTRRIGELLRRNWELKRRLASGISTASIEELMTLASENGMTGGKIAGAGGGGFLLAHCPLGDQERLRTALASYRELPFMFERDGCKIIFNNRRYGWK